MILIIAPDNDYHATQVAARLDSRSIPYVLLNTGEYQRHLNFSLRIGTAIDELSTFGSVPFRDVRSVWYRRPKLPTALSGLSEQSRGFAESESKTALYGALHTLASAHWCNRFDRAELSENKPLQLLTARAVGLPLPPTLITNKAEEARAFLEEQGDIIYKPFYFHPLTLEGGLHAIYTNRVSLAHLEDDSVLEHAPCLFQKQITKSVELRVTVIGNQFFTAELDTQTSERSSLDWRRYDFKNVAYKSSDVPDFVKTQILDLMSRLGLVFGCIDLILTPEGEYVFLEVNQAGQWMWVEALTDLKITDAFIEFLNVN